MAVCDNCGKPVYRLDRTCANCGASVTQYSQSSYGDSRGRSRLNDDFSQSSSYDVLSTWGFVGSMVVMSLPLIGFIMTIVWASGGTANLNRRISRADTCSSWALASCSRSLWHLRLLHPESRSTNSTNSTT